MCITLWDPSKSFSLNSSRIFNSTTAWFTKRFLFLIIFIATCWFVLWSRARITWPKLPFPITSKISYLKAIWSCSTCERFLILCFNNKEATKKSLQFYNFHFHRHIHYSMWIQVWDKFYWPTVQNTKFCCKFWPPRTHPRSKSFRISWLTLKKKDKLLARAFQSEIKEIQWKWSLNHLFTNVRVTLSTAM